eukprot:6421864-Lingulodinium_polyedra.AAC.1
MIAILANAASLFGELFETFCTPQYSLASFKLSNGNWVTRFIFPIRCAWPMTAVNSRLSASRHWPPR